MIMEQRVQQRLNQVFLNRAPLRVVERPSLPALPDQSLLSSLHYYFLEAQHAVWTRFDYEWDRRKIEVISGYRELMASIPALLTVESSSG